MNKGTVYWFTGISGAGKSTLGELFVHELRKNSNNVVFLDGDELRAAVAPDLGYTRKERFECAMRYSRLCRLLSNEGINVVIATISMFHEVRDWNRENIDNYLEIYLEVPVEMVAELDPKGVYNGLNGYSGTSVVGVDVQMETPENPDFHIVNDRSETMDILAEKLIPSLLERTTP